MVISTNSSPIQLTSWFKHLENKTQSQRAAEYIAFPNCIYSVSNLDFPICELEKPGESAKGVRVWFPE